jgi:alpha-2-macroglobulin
VHSGIPGQRIHLELRRGPELRWRRTLVAGRDAPWIDLPVGAADRGGLGVRATIVADHQRIDRAATLAVPWEDKELEVELASFRDRLAPGERETVRVVVRRGDGRPLGADAVELLASMVDRSLDLFRAHAVPRGETLWPTFGAPPEWLANLGQRGPVWQEGRDWGARARPPSFRADAYVGLDPYGVGGPGVGGPRMLALGAEGRRSPAPQAMAEGVLPAPEAADAAEAARASGAPAAESPAPAPIVPRTDFSETAFFLPHLVAGEDGAAAIEFRVPEALTSWRLWISAWTRELASGYLERELRTTKELMVRPYLPRFLREGDAAS